jgi:hypothetical protein
MVERLLVRDSFDVIGWRFDELRRAGWPINEALQLAERTDVDLHEACELLAQGCSVEVALRILT